MPFIYAVSLRLKQFLKERELTQYQLAKRSGIPDSTLSYVIRAKCKSVTTETLLNVCRGLDIRIKDFFDDEMFNFENISDD